jgi:hypothetical protein
MIEYYIVLAQVMAGIALGISLTCLVGTWYMHRKEREHWDFMYSSLEARLAILEAELDRHLEEK